MKKVLTVIVACIAALSSYAQPKAGFTTDEFDNFTLHTYASFDAMANVSFIVETEKSLIIMEPQSFKGKVEEFMAYTDKLNKPIDKVLVSFHPSGLKVYANEQKVITKPMSEFVKSDKAKGMLAHFEKAFKGAMDTEVVAFDEHLDSQASFTVDGVVFSLEPTLLPGMPGVNISIGDKVYYQHFAPAKGFHASKHQINSANAIDAAITEALKAKKGKYTLLLGSHGVGKASIEDLYFHIKYLKTMKKVAAKATTTEEFIKQFSAKYPTCKGDEDLTAIAASIYK